MHYYGPTMTVRGKVIRNVPTLPYVSTADSAIPLSLVGDKDMNTQRELDVSRVSWQTRGAFGNSYEYY